MSSKIKTPKPWPSSSLADRFLGDLFPAPSQELDQIKGRMTYWTPTLGTTTKEEYDLYRQAVVEYRKVNDLRPRDLTSSTPEQNQAIHKIYLSLKQKCSKSSS